MITVKETITCRICGCSFESDSFYPDGSKRIPGLQEITGKAFFRRTLCDVCDDLEQDKKTETAKIERKQGQERSFASVCPPHFLEVLKRLEPGKACESVASWKYNSRGILCFGDSRKGKTTACWALLSLLHGQGFKFTALTETEFALEASENSKGWLLSLVHVPILFLDDIGHANTSSRHLEKLYYVVDQRTKFKKPIIATSQFSETDLKAKSKQGEKTLLAIINRLREFCQIVNF